MEEISSALSFGGQQKVFSHQADTVGCEMRFGIYLPPQAAQGPVPCLTWLSGLTCTEENFIVKAGAQRMAAELGLAIVAPDTSPRGDDVPDVEEYDFAKGAGFYLNATEAPWSTHYQMYDYITQELTPLIAREFPIKEDHQGIFGHSMGGHGAITIHLKNPQTYKSVSAFAPIVAPTQVPWGQSAFRRYLGDDEESWRQYDSCELALKQPSPAEILVDQGAADGFLSEHLQPERLEAACKESGQPLKLRMQEGYDHSYFFIASFIEDHLRHHAQALG